MDAIVKSIEAGIAAWTLLLLGDEVLPKQGGQFEEAIQIGEASIEQRRCVWFHQMERNVGDNVSRLKLQLIREQTPLAVHPLFLLGNLKGPRLSILSTRRLRGTYEASMFQINDDLEFFVEIS